MSRSPEFPRRAAFTLVELLAVVAIIGVLAGILIAVLGKTRSSARNTACISNLRQIGAAFLLHAAEKKGALPPVQVQDQVWPQKTWMYQIQPYLENRRPVETVGMIGLCYDGPFHCPAKEDWALVGSGVTDLQRTSYGMNSFVAVGLAAAGLSDYPAMRLNAFTLPARTMLAGDFQNSDYKIHNRDYLYRTEAARLSLRHSDRHNVVMLDGHVESLERGALNYYLVKTVDSEVRAY